MSVNVVWAGERKILGKIPGVAKYDNYSCTYSHAHVKTLDASECTTQKLSALSIKIASCMSLYEEMKRKIEESYDSGIITSNGRNKLLRLFDDELASDARLLDVVQKAMVSINS